MRFGPVRIVGLEAWAAWMDMEGFVGVSGKIDPRTGRVTDADKGRFAPEGGTPPAICFNCGEWKEAIFGRCEECGASPKTENDLAASLVLSDRYSSPRDLERLGASLKAGQTISLNQRHLANAMGAIRDPRFRNSIGLALALDPPLTDHPLTNPRWLWVLLTAALGFLVVIALSSNG
ncbi:MAG: hypothetical protein OQJ99_06320 [Rhodospirillales bacterium]|nr:hypothetical protein [Rhodospirillales bacterium]MCW9003112.1 hypothetical protein [Rhodospirillales bacterium]